MKSTAHERVRYFFVRLRFFLLHQLDNLAHLFGDVLVALPFVGAQATRAVFDAVLGVGEATAAVFSQGIEGAVAENAGEGFRVGILMTGEVFTLLVLEKIIMCHSFTSFELVPGKFIGWGSGEGQLLTRFGVAEAQKA